MMREKLLILIFLICAMGIHAQQLTTYIYDQESNTPVKDAHILFENTEVQLFSDLEGKVVLPANTRGKGFIVSHISYQLASRDIPLVGDQLDTIYLDRAAEILQNVVITESKNDLKKERLKQFKKDLFNSETISKSLYKKVKILNPEVIIFQEKGDTLVASSQQLIQLRNEYLGYDMQFYLQDYLSTEDFVSCKGTAFFKPIIAKKGKSKRVREEENKREIWNESAALFYQNLLLQKLDPGVSYYERRPNGKDYLLRDYSQLYDQVFRTPIEGIYAIAMPYNLIYKYGKNESEIGSRSKIILINEQGVVVNSSDYILEGYWRRKSITELLPNSYCRNISKELSQIYKREYSLASVQQKVKDILYKSENIVAQQIELTTDKLLYDGAPISVSAYVYEYQTGSPVHNQIVHFQFIDESGKIIRQKSTQLSEGWTHVDFLTLLLPQGKYCIKAYTDYMKALDESTYGYATVAYRMVKSNPELIDNKINLKFTPEGKNIIADQSNRVLFSVTDTRGLPAEFEGVILDTVMDTSYIIRTIQPGVAAADIRFSEESQFDIAGDINHDLNSYKQHLGKVSTQVLDRGKYFRVNTIQKENNNNLTLQILHRGLEILSYPIDSLKQSIKIEKEYLPKGLLLAAVKNNNTLKIESYRYFQNDLPTEILNFESSYEYCYTGQPMHIDIDNTSDFDLQWTFSISNDELNEVAQKITHPYINHLSLISKNLSAIDSLLIVDDIPFAVPSSTLSISGTVISAIDSTPVSAYVLLTSMDQSIHIKETQSDSAGRFVINNLPFKAYVDYIIQARILDGDEEDPMDGDRRLHINIDRPEISSSYFSMLPLSNIISADSLNRKEEYLEEFESDVLLEEVSVSALIKKQSHDYNGIMLVNKLDWLSDKSNALSIIRNIYPNAKILEDPKMPGEYLIYVRFPSQKYQPLQVMVDDVLRDDAILLSLKKPHIWQLRLNGPFVMIRSNPNYKTDEQKLMEQGITYHRISGIPTLSHNHNILPIVKVLGDNRTTLYWQSGQSIPAGQRHRINLIASDIAGKYTLTATAHHPIWGKIEQRHPIEIKEAP